ncbi:uncharacterized protein N7459_001457 [Penicillium hispanicum]|uniref:uncharacterized protein n=1 Tax=Penicillium hispanicum TaxID=1080232 RepID=UPI0025403BDA|nr:uncharacterized protein N7459_001457 [Penicillium hispanicum]KAJ5595249.1 hypothetical protein N7459_001457 [Penicillium hispanicum]
MHSQSYPSRQYPQRSLSQTSATTTSSRSTRRSDEKKHTRKTSNPLASKLFRSRSKSPTPVEIPQHHSRQHSSSVSQPRDIPRSNPDTYFDRDHSTSPVQMSPDNASPRSAKGEFHSERPYTPTRKNSDDYRRYSGTINHCGRHSNDWLFGGFSVRDTVREGIEKLRNHDKES